MRAVAVLRMFLLAFLLFLTNGLPAAEPLQAGFAEADVTPKLGDKAVFMAGFGHNRKATEVADPIMARGFVLKHDKQKLAFVCIDVVGFFHANVERVRKQLPGFDYVLISSTHNHEGPDTLGLWGSSPFKSGIDPEYMKRLEEQIVEVVQTAQKALRPVTAKIAAARHPELLHDSRMPIILHDDLVVLQFLDEQMKKPAGIVVQWNCHPETLADKNTKLSGDFVGYAVKEVAAKQACPVVYLTGTVGGLMSSLKTDIRSEKGEKLEDGTFEKAKRYGQLLGQAANKALKDSKDVSLTPFQVRHRHVYLPVDNKIYQLGRQMGVLQREAFLWTGDPMKAEAAPAAELNKKRSCLKTEVAWLRLGDLDIACIPGEIYPELVLDKVPDPAPEGADFPDAPVEPAIYKQLRGPHRMIIGLANDEIGYVIPKRQWDEKPPFTYGNMKPPYGEINSLGPETAPLLCEAFRALVQGNK
ncbi:MAG TPA: hypothetical protein VKS79_09255 [Gemmataceae bacterium]|nr:hypothetical protein [Gemmataceae bacterium]